MLTSLSISHDMVIEKEHIDAALALLMEVEKDLYSIFGGAGRNELGNVALKIFSYIHNAGESPPLPQVTVPILQRMQAAQRFRDLHPASRGPGRGRYPPGIGERNRHHLHLGTPQVMSRVSSCEFSTSPGRVGPAHPLVQPLQLIPCSSRGCCRFQVIHPDRIAQHPELTGTPSPCSTRCLNCALAVSLGIFSGNP